jgi:hypothetical protein
LSQSRPPSATSRIHFVWSLPIYISLRTKHSIVDTHDWLLNRFFWKITWFINVTLKS